MPQLLKAVHDNDLLVLLEHLDLLEKFNAGNIICPFCGDAIGMENLHSILPEAGTIKLVCSRPTCVTALIQKVEGAKYG